MSSYHRCLATVSQANRTETGWNPEHIARAWAELMRRLGYKRYVSQGGDWGSVVADAMAGRRLRVC